jgi:hypothetical protein
MRDASVFVVSGTVEKIDETSNPSYVRVQIHVVDDEYGREDHVEFSMKSDGVSFDIDDHVIVSGNVGGKISNRGGCFNSLFARSVTVASGVDSGPRGKPASRGRAAPAQAASRGGARPQRNRSPEYDEEAY